MARPSKRLNEKQEKQVREFLEKGMSLSQIAPLLDPPVKCSALPRKIHELGLEVELETPPVYRLVPIRVHSASNASNTSNSSNASVSTTSEENRNV